MRDRLASPSSYRRLRVGAGLMLVFAAVGACFEFADSGAITFWGPLIGIVLAVVLALVENSPIARRLRSLPFLAAVLSRAVLNIAAIAIPFAALGLLGGALEGLRLTDFVEWILSYEFLRRVAIAFGLYVALLFVRDLDRLLGPGILVRYLIGRYHRPRQEERIFMFLDMKASTELAESLSPEAYFGLLNTFFRDVADPVIGTSAEIYQYVGDEVVLTWPLRKGLKNANCLQVFFDVERVVTGKRDLYLSRYGIVPGFKAGVHLGRVVAAEIGDLKKDIVFNGDVLNTAARIRGSCNELGERLVASADLVSRMQIPYWLETHDLGPVRLKGKAQPVPLTAIRRATANANPAHSAAGSQGDR